MTAPSGSPVQDPITLVPHVTPEEQQSLTLLWVVLESSREAIREKLEGFVASHAELAEVVRRSDPERARPSQEANRELQCRAITLGEWRPYVESLLSTDGGLVDRKR